MDKRAYSEENEAPEMSMRKKVLTDLQDDMAGRRVLNLTIDLDKGTVKTKGGESPDDEMNEHAAGGEGMAEPTNIDERLKKVLG